MTINPDESVATIKLSRNWPNGRTSLFTRSNSGYAGSSRTSPQPSAGGCGTLKFNPSGIGSADGSRIPGASVKGARAIGSGEAHESGIRGWGSGAVNGEIGY